MFSVYILMIVLVASTQVEICFTEPWNEAIMEVRLKQSVPCCRSYWCSSECTADLRQKLVKNMADKMRPNTVNITAATILTQFTFCNVSVRNGPDYYRLSYLVMVTLLRVDVNARWVQLLRSATFGQWNRFSSIGVTIVKQLLHSAPAAFRIVVMTALSRALDLGTT